MVLRTFDGLTMAHAVNAFSKSHESALLQFSALLHINKQITIMCQTACWMYILDHIQRWAHPNLFSYLLNGCIIWDSRKSNDKVQPFLENSFNFFIQIQQKIYEVFKFTLKRLFPFSQGRLDYLAQHGPHVFRWYWQTSQRPLQ